MERYEGPAVGYEPIYPDVKTYFNSIGNLYTWEADPWFETCDSWSESCYIHAGISGAEITFHGPDAKDFISMLAINRTDNWKPSTCKHLVQLDDDGLIAAHGLVMKDADDTYRMTAALPFAAIKLLETGKYDVAMDMRDIFVFQFSGPKSLTIIEKVLQADLHDLEFLEFRTVKAPGIDADLEVNRIGMSGTLAYEIRGAAEFGPTVYNAAYELGKPLGLKRLGWRSYPVNHAFGGFPQINVSFETALYRDEKFLEMTLNPFELGGSVDPADLRARFRSVTEVGWEWMADFNHDFVGKEALKKELENPKRTIVTLIWNPEDVVDVQASLFREGEPYPQFDMPCALKGMHGGFQDYVTTADGEVIGWSSSAVYGSHYRKMVSECTIDLAHAKEGEEVIVKWGNFGGPIKDIRATVAKFPLNELEDNKGYDLSKCPKGYEG